MAPHAEFDNSEIVRLPFPERPPFSASPPRLLIIGAGNRGTAYAAAIGKSTNGICVGVVEPIAQKRLQFGRKYVWGDSLPSPGQEFSDWRDYISWESERRMRAAAGEKDVPEGVDGIFICVQDQMHKDVVLGLGPLGIHLMCEKPLATSLDDCVSIYKALLPDPSVPPSKIFSIGHVLRYTPHNMLLRKLLLDDKVIGDVMAVSHTEPVGWWHFTHSYVRLVTTFMNLKRLTNSEGIGGKSLLLHHHFSQSPAMTWIFSSGSSALRHLAPPKQHIFQVQSLLLVHYNTSINLANPSRLEMLRIACHVIMSPLAISRRRESTLALKWGVAKSILSVLCYLKLRNALPLVAPKRGRRHCCRNLERITTTQRLSQRSV